MDAQFERDLQSVLDKQVDTCNLAFRVLRVKQEHYELNSERDKSFNVFDADGKTWAGRRIYIADSSGAKLEEYPFSKSHAGTDDKKMEFQGQAAHRGPLKSRSLKRNASVPSLLSAPTTSSVGPTQSKPVSEVGVQRDSGSRGAIPQAGPPTNTSGNRIAQAGETIDPGKKASKGKYPQSEPLSNMLQEAVGSSRNLDWTGAAMPPECRTETTPPRSPHFSSFNPLSRHPIGGSRRAWIEGPSNTATQPGTATGSDQDFTGTKRRSSQNTYGSQYDQRKRNRSDDR